MGLRRALCVACVALPMLACGEPVRLVLVEALQQAGAGGSGGLGLAGVGAAPATGGASGSHAGDAGAGGTPSGPPWEAPTLYTASYVSHAVPGQYLRHVAAEAVVGAVDLASLAEKQAASFEIIPGMWDDSCISLRAVDDAAEASFLRHAGSRLLMHPYPVDADFQLTNLFQADATYCLEPGFADPDGVSFRSTNYPQRLIRMRPGGEVWTDYIENTPEFASESTFFRETALSER